MDEKKNSRYNRSTQYIYNSQFEVGNKNRLETQATFRSVFSIYSIEEDAFIEKKGEKWNINNYGGIPVDFDSTKKIVYVDSSDSHTLLIGATGSKKSRLVVMPTVKILSSAGESMIITDPKGEIYRRMANDLKNKSYNIRVINLREPQTGDMWNFLSLPYKNYKLGNLDKACEMVNDTAVTLMPIMAKDPYWDFSSRDLFVGLVILLFKICVKYDLPDSMVNMRNLLALRANMFISSHTKKIKMTPYWKEAEEDEFIKTKLIGTVVCPENTMSCILSTFDQHVSCFSLRPQLIEMLSGFTMDFEKCGYEKTAIFIIMPDEKTTYHKLVTLFIKQIYEQLIDLTYFEEKDNRFPIRINFILDEFSSIPSISDFPQMIVAARSRNIRFHLVMQSKNQLKQRYKEEAETIQSNCNNWIFLYTKEIELLREISALGGSKGREELISISRLQHLDKNKGECLAFLGRMYPYYANLADIDEYDEGKFVVLPLNFRQGITSSETIIDYKKIFGKEVNKELINDVFFVDED